MGAAHDHCNCIKAICEKSERCDHVSQLVLNDLSGCFQRCIVDCLHGRDGVDSCDFNLPFAEILDDHIARQHQSDLVFDLKCVMRQAGIARPQNAVIAKFDVKLFLECRLQVDLGYDTESFLL